MSALNQSTLDETSIAVRGDFLISPLSTLMIVAFRRALELQHKLPEPILRMQGMSGRKYRYFINNMISMIGLPRYLEVGSWAGSTACAAMYGNAGKILCIDNWSEFGGPKDQFISNINAAKNPRIDFQFIEQDFRSVDYSSIGSFNVYLFDGPHEYKDQYDGLMMAQPALDREFIFIVDDWNWERVRQGTFSAIKDSKLVIVSSIEIKTSQTNGTPKLKFEESEWHNGYFIAHCLKKDKL
jgi:hypothetical protein